jgi:phage-related protein
MSMCRWTCRESKCGTREGLVVDKVDGERDLDVDEAGGGDIDCEEMMGRRGGKG